MMMDQSAKQEFERKGREAKDENFRTFMGQPTIRLLMSKMPETEPELLEALLKEAHSHGWTSGSAFNAVSFLEVMMKQELKRR